MPMAVTMQLNEADKLKLLGLMIRFPKETYRGLGRAGSIVRGKMRKVMRTGGGEGVGTFAPMDAVTATVRGPHKLGGVLAKTHAIQMYKNGKGSITIGFLSALEPWAKAFQEKESRALTEGEVNHFRRFGVKPTPEQYNRPARNMVEPFAKHYEKDFLRYAIENTNKILNKVRK